MDNVIFGKWEQEGQKKERNKRSSCTCHEAIYEHGGIAPLILNHGTI